MGAAVSLVTISSSALSASAISFSENPYFKVSV
jgi:hypothetical protein